MKYLLINTANKVLRLTLAIDDQIFSYENNSPRKHNEVLLGAIDELLAKNGLKIEDIDAFGVVIGPGSFTGIRVGIATVKAFRDALKKDAVGINNLELLSRMSGGRYCAIMGSNDSYFFAENTPNGLYIHDRNLTKAEVDAITKGESVYFYAQENSGEMNAQFVAWDDGIFVDTFVDMLARDDRNLQPVYYQLSQAEREKIDRSDVVITRATSADVDKVMSIDKECFADAWSEHTMTDELANHYVYIAHIDDIPVGYIDAVDLVDEWSVMRVAVSPRYQNHGIGARLIGHIETTAKSHNIGLVSLEVDEKNHKALSLYSKLGYITRRIRKNYYPNGSDAIEMSKNF